MRAFMTQTAEEQVRFSESVRQLSSLAEEV
jgi:hypothetical protein